MSSAKWIVALLTAMAFPGFSAAEEVMSMAERLDALEARLARFESTNHSALQPVPAYEHGMSGGCCACDSCDSYCDYECIEDWTRPDPGIFASGELLMLAWADTDGDDDQDSVEHASRTTLGYMNGCGRGIRARYFEFATMDEIGTGSLQVEHIDLEYIARFDLGLNWDGDISLGGRYATLRNPTPRIYEDTFGPLIGVGLRSEITDWLSIYGGLRQSFQFGRELTENDQKHFGITELSLGLEWTREHCCCKTFARTGFESQFYTSVRDDEEDFGLYGYTIQIGIRR